MQVQKINYQNQMNNVQSIAQRTNHAPNFKGWIPADEIYKTVNALQEKGSPKLQELVRKLLNELCSQNGKSTSAFISAGLAGEIALALSNSDNDTSEIDAKDSSVQYSYVDDSFGQEWQNYFANFESNSSSNGAHPVESSHLNEKMKAVFALQRRFGFTPSESDFERAGIHLNSAEKAELRRMHEDNERSDNYYKTHHGYVNDYDDGSYKF